MKYNILYLHETSRFSGAEESLFNLMRFQNHNLFNAFFILPEAGQFSDKLEDIGIKVFIVSLPRIRRIRGVMLSVKKILRIAKENNIHLLHTNSIRTHMYGAYVAKKLKIPIIWHERNLITKEIFDPDRLFSFLADKIICNSYAIARRFLRKDTVLQSNNSKIAVIYNGVDTERFNPGINGQALRREFGIRSDEIVIGIASRFGADKGHDTFLKAAKILLSHEEYEKIPLRFLIVGNAVFAKDKWREDYLRKMAKDLGIADKIIFTGFRQDMPQVYAAMDIFVLASEAEPCGRVLFEAMASAKPIIATNSGGTPEIVKEAITGFLVKPKQPQELAQKIGWLVNNLAKAKMMAEAGWKRIEADFKIGRNVAEIEAVYAELLKGAIG
jgi:glycosyltransferase involved in cell wall biosynthesis